MSKKKPAKAPPPAKDAKPEAKDDAKKADLRLSPKDHKAIMDLFQKGYEAAQKDPEKVWTEKRLREDQTPPFHGFHQLVTKDDKPMEKAFFDHTQPIVEADEMLYERVKKLAMRRGYEASDFEEGGPLFGWSTNEILDLLRDKAGG